MSEPELPPSEGLAPEPVSSEPTATDTVAVKRSGHRRATKRHRVLRGVLTGVVCFVMVLGLASAYWYRHLNGNLNSVDVSSDILVHDVSPIDAGPNGPINILVMGSDTRDCAGCGIDHESGGGSDTTILVHLSADRKSAYAISIPRDSIVDRPACKLKDGSILPAATGVMWNAAYSYGGAACTIAQFEETTKIYVDHYVVVNFEGFKKMVDAVGGVDVCIPEDWIDPSKGINLKAGVRKISGRQALQYVRVRYRIGDGTDIGREKRQQAFIGSMINTAMSKGVLSNPIKLVKFLNAATASLQVDPGIGDIKALGGLAWQLRSIGLSNIKFITTPNTYNGAPPGRVLWTSDAAILWNRIRHDLPVPKRFLTGALNAEQIPGLTPSNGPSSNPTTSASGSPSNSPSTSPSGSPTSSSSPTANPTYSSETEDIFHQSGLCA